jgi:hypothetical protein
MPAKLSNAHLFSYNALSPRDGGVADGAYLDNLPPRRGLGAIRTRIAEKAEL